MYIILSKETNFVSFKSSNNGCNFDSNGPMDGGDTYPVTEEGNMDEPEITYDAMESAFNDDEMGEQDISGVQGIYGDMDPSFDFDNSIYFFTLSLFLFAFGYFFLLIHTASIPIYV